MTLNHINLTVTDVPAARDFLATYFGLRPAEGAGRESTFALLFDDRGMVVTLIRSRREFQYPETFHIGFGQESEERVNEIHRRLKENGFDAPEPARLHGSWTFYITAPGGFTVEVLA